jgi:hypothetical protein
MTQGIPENVTPSLELDTLAKRRANVPTDIYPSVLEQRD